MRRLATCSVNRISLIVKSFCSDRISTLSIVKGKYRPTSSSKSNFSKVSFDDLTNNIAFYKEKFEENEKTKISKIPWKFGAEKVENFQEMNLKGIIDYNDIISEDIVKKLFLSYYNGFVKMSAPSLFNVTENLFCASLRRHFEHQKQNCLNIVSSFEPVIHDISLYNINSILGIGVSKNRKRNKKLENYRIIEQYDNETPLRIILKKKKKADELVKVYLQFSLAITCETQLALMNKTFSHEKEDGISTHFMEIEVCIMEALYRSWKSSFASIDEIKSNFLGQTKLHSASDLQFYIIDFDSYMNGNPFISA